MRNFPEQAKQALRMYLERGRTALQVADSGDFASLDEALRWRKAAFHNFRVADTLAQKAGEDVSRDPEVKGYADEIRIVDRRLQEVLTGLAQDTSTQLRRLSLSRQKIRRYQSGRLGHPTFTHSV